MKLQKGPIKVVIRKNQLSAAYFRNEEAIYGCGVLTGPSHVVFYGDWSGRSFAKLVKL